MTKFLFLFIAFSSLLFSAKSQQITNGDFENWTDGNDAEVWNSFNFLSFHSATQSSNAHGGTYAANLTSGSLLGQFMPGLITLGVIDMANQTITGGIPFTDRPTGISYFFKYQAQNNDTSYMIALLTKWNDATQQTDTVGMTGYFTADTYVNYTELNVPFFYNSTETPDTLNVIFISSGFNGTAGSTLIIDDVTLLYGAVISPTFCFPASEITYSSFTTRCMTIPSASSYRLDVSESIDFASFVSGYEDLDIGTDTFAIVNLNAGLYFYRKRVVYGSETSINSNKMAVPMPCLNADATNISSNSFTANWQIANNATNYIIDIATDANFTNILTSYNNLSVGNTASYLIQNLEVETEYFYRVRVEYEDGNYLSRNSNVISVQTSVGIENIVSGKIKIYSSDNKAFIINNNKELPNNITIFNIQGKKIKTITNPKNKEVLFIENKGMYIVNLQYPGFVINKKVIIR